MPHKLIKSAVLGRYCRIKRESLIVFVCGRRLDDASSRRKMFLEYAHKHLTSYRFLLAESFFEVEKDITPQNMLDDEHRLAKYSDGIIIILESESAFAELGAFASVKDLQRCLIIVNDKAHRNAESFVAKGIIKPLERAFGESGLCIHTDWDAFASSFRDISRRLERISRKQSRQLIVLNRDEFLSKNKDRLLLIHDLIGLLAPIDKSEIIDLVILLYGSGRYDPVHFDIQLLQAVGLVTKFEDHFFTTQPGERFIWFPGDKTYSIRAACISFYKKRQPYKLSMLARKYGYAS